MSDSNGQLPTGWSWRSLGDLSARVQYGWTTRAVAAAPGTRLLRTTDLTSGRVDPRVLPACAESPPDKEKYLLAPGDLLVSRAGSVGRSFLVTDELPDTVFASYLIRFQLNADAVPSYVAHFMQSPAYWRFISEESTGITIGNVNAAKLKRLTIPLPPIEEQRRIAAKLDDLLGRVTAARERLDRVPAILHRFRRAVLAAAVSGRLSGNSSANGSLPDGWTESPFGELVDNFDGKRIPVKADERKSRSGPYPYYGASGIIDYVDGFLFDGDFLLVSEDGANLLARSTPIAFVASGQFWVNNHAHVVRAKERVDAIYLQHFINGLDVQEYVTGSAQPKLTQAALNRIRVSLPPLAEQHQIVTTTNGLLTMAGAAARRHSVAATSHARITHSILARAFTGGL